MVEEDAWYDYNFLKLITEVWFVTQDMVYPGECSMCTWEEGVFFFIGWNILKISMRSISSNVSLKTCVSLLLFCFDDLSIGVSGVLRAPLFLSQRKRCSEELDDFLRSQPYLVAEPELGPGGQCFSHWSFFLTWIIHCKHSELWWENHWSILGRKVHDCFTFIKAHSGYQMQNKHEGGHR